MKASPVSKRVVRSFHAYRNRVVSKRQSILFTCAPDFFGCELSLGRTVPRIHHSFCEMSRDADHRNPKRKRSVSPLAFGDSKLTPGSSSTKNGGSSGNSSADAGSSASHVYWSRVQIGKPAPDFVDVPAVVNGAFREISLKTYHGKYLVIVFYPLDFTYVCPTEITAFSDRIGEFKELACEVIAVSVDSKYSHLAWTSTSREKGGLGNVRIPLLSDYNHKMSRDYGVFSEELGHTIRGLFIVDPKGLVRHATLNDLSIGRSVDESKRVLEALQFNSEYGDVCPADWKPGQATIIPTPDDSKEYFKLHYKI